METYELSEKEFKIIMLRKSSEIQENTDNSVNSEKQCMNKIRGSTEKSHTHKNLTSRIQCIKLKIQQRDNNEKEWLFLQNIERGGS